MAEYHKCDSPGCEALVRTKYRRCDRCRLDTGTTTPRVIEATPEEQVAADREKLKLSKENGALKSKYQEALKTIDRLEGEVGIIQSLDEQVERYAITPAYGAGTSECTVVMVASDWHCEEKVGSEVGNLNRFDLDRSQARANRFFTAGLRLTQLLNKDVKINNVVLALLGDFISGDIHEEVAEVCQLPPMEAAIFAEQMIISGIEFLLEHSDYNLIIPCHSGNHARTTKTTRFATENGHSIEYLMYRYLAAYFRSEPRVTFIIPEGPHSYLDVYDQTIRFQHGHMIKYNGGRGRHIYPDQQGDCPVEQGGTRGP
jgi:hypothetical protein